MWTSVCVSVCLSVPKLMCFSFPPGNLDTGTFGHQDKGDTTGTLEHRETGILGQCDNVCVRAFRSSPPPKVTGKRGHQDAVTPGHWDTGTPGHQ